MNVAASMNLDMARVSRLRDYLIGLHDPDANGQDLYRHHQADLENVTPLELMELFNEQFQSGQTPEQIFQYLDKVINAVSHALRSQTPPPPEPGTFIHLLSSENQALEQRLGAIRNQLLMWTGDLSLHASELSVFVGDLSDCQNHYEKIQNILFPMLEKRHVRFHGLAILWALQDHARQMVRQTVECLGSPDRTDRVVRENLGKMFFALQGLINKEQWILFPIAVTLFTDREHSEMLAQTRDYAPAFLSKDDFGAYFTEEKLEYSTSHRPGQEAVGSGFPSANSFSAASSAYLQTATGNLSAEQAIQIFNVLPVDLSFVDSNNNVQYFTKPKDRIFPRSPAVIGREVERCHPPSSVHVVQKIITEFREGRRDSARFWIDLHGRKIMIEYFAVRDDKGDYLGVLEVSQDITDIQQLSGQQRLLDWE